MVLSVCFQRRIQLQTKSLPAKPAFSYHNSPVSVAVNNRKNTCQRPPSCFTSFLLSCLLWPVRAGMGCWHPVLAFRHPQSLSPPRLKWTLVPEPSWLGDKVCQVPAALILYCDCHQSFQRWPQHYFRYLYSHVPFSPSALILPMKKEGLFPLPLNLVGTSLSLSELQQKRC